MIPAELVLIGIVLLLLATVVALVLVVLSRAS